METMVIEYITMELCSFNKKIIATCIHLNKIVCTVSVAKWLEY